MDLFEWLRVIAPIVMLLVSGLTAVAAFFGKQIIRSFTEELKRLRSDHEQLEKDFLKFQAHLPHIYSLKTDQQRDMTLVEHKIDNLASELKSGIAEISSQMMMVLRELPKGRNDGAS